MDNVSKDACLVMREDDYNHSVQSASGMDFIESVHTHTHMCMRTCTHTLKKNTPLQKKRGGGK